MPNNIFVGKKEDFALNIVFEPDPDAGQSTTEEESLSWGSLEIWVHGKNLCSHVEESELVSSVHWYLLPFIDWLARNWNPLLHEERLPNWNAGDDAWQSLFKTRFPPISYEKDAENEWNMRWQEWQYRHSLRSCRSGGMFPDVVIRRWRDMVEVSWNNESLPGIPEEIMFIYSHGFVRLDPEKVAPPLYEVLQKTIQYLTEQLPDSERLLRTRQIIDAVKNSSKNERLAWLAGLGFSAQGIERWRKITQLVRKAPKKIAEYLLEVTDDDLVLKGSCHAALMFGSASPTLTDTDLEILAEKLIELYSPNSEGSKLQDLVANEPILLDKQPAWELGYDLAEQVIEYFSLEENDADSINISAILNALGIRQEKIELSDKKIRGVSIAGPYHQPSILINCSDSRNDTFPGERFTLAHELCHILFDRSYGKKLAMASDGWAPLQIEKRANAFAAMLLMPSKLVHRAIAALTVPLASERAVHEVRKRLETSFDGTLEHLKNLGWLDQLTAEQIAETRKERFSNQEAKCSGFLDS
ncbi:ImmA/IrrE family metallo-endopeptidase [Desulfomonile tiedjei]|uniref:Putative Zn peptidase n=1 Tax=Desulfomonile tiedjei (strain ATCC 49306 / DSM 6799 / DCB-1) TaxID=706587 RepID=I4C8M5_DESTA|nr:ImmA/IrrE family metallo-endopeptidase [Desulfomonile tiedjei]AFM25916.1 putative Zn peptidase [Desulfomonile tiedjei DSM 6799]